MDPSDRPPAAELDGVTLSIGHTAALVNVSLQVPDGATVGLVGPNGAGKTTLLQVLLGIALPQLGRVRVLGRDPLALDDATRERLGYVPQWPELLEWMPVGQYLDYIGSFYPRWDPERTARRAAQWRLGRDERVSSLTPGKRQTLALLLALGHEPDLLVLDEPVASLDPLMRRRFMQELFDTERPRSVVISSHLLGDLERIVTHLAFMRDGGTMLVDEWDRLAEDLVRVESPQRLPVMPGLLTQRESQGRHVAVFDRRQWPSDSMPAGTSHNALNLDELYVELMS